MIPAAGPSSSSPTGDVAGPVTTPARATVPEAAPSGDATPRETPAFASVLSRAGASARNSATQPAEPPARTAKGGSSRRHVTTSNAADTSGAAGVSSPVVTLATTGVSESARVVRSAPPVAAAPAASQRPSAPARSESDTATSVTSGRDAILEHLDASRSVEQSSPPASETLASSRVGHGAVSAVSLPSALTRAYGDEAARHATTPVAPVSENVVPATSSPKLPDPGVAAPASALARGLTLSARGLASTPSGETSASSLVTNASPARARSGAGAGSMTTPAPEKQSTRVSVTTDRGLSALADGAASLTRPTSPSLSVGPVTAPSAVRVPSLSALDVGAVVGAISRPVVDGGGYSVVVAMHPSELGQLQAVVSQHGNDLHVVITPETRPGHDALASAVNTLRDELSRGGLNVNVTLRDPGSHPGERRDGASTPATRTDDATTISPRAPESLTLGASQIHLVL